MSKEFRPNAPPVSGAATAAPVAKAALVRSGKGGKRERRSFDDAPAQKPILDPISKAIGDTVFAQSARFDWCANAGGIRYAFGRNYVRLRVLLDVFSAVTDAVAAEIGAKSAAIEAYNATHEEAPFGYVPYITGAQLDGPSVAFAKAGGIVPLIRMHAVA